MGRAMAWDAIQAEIDWQSLGNLINAFHQSAEGLIYSPVAFWETFGKIGNLFVKNEPLSRLTRRFES